MFTLVFVLFSDNLVYLLSQKILNIETENVKEKKWKCVSVTHACPNKSAASIKRGICYLYSNKNIQISSLFVAVYNLNVSVKLSQAPLLLCQSLHIALPSLRRKGPRKLIFIMGANEIINNSQISRKLFFLLLEMTRIARTNQS